MTPATGLVMIIGTFVIGIIALLALFSLRETSGYRGRRRMGERHRPGRAPGLMSSGLTVDHETFEDDSPTRNLASAWRRRP